MALLTTMSVGVAGTFGYLVYTEPYLKYFLPALTFQGMFLLAAYTIVRQMEMISSQNAGVRALSQLLMNISFPMAFFITLLSWGLAIPVDAGGLWTFKNHFYHSINSIICLVYVGMDTRVWRTENSIQPLLAGLAYVASQGALQWTGYPAQYPFLDFKANPTVAGIIVLGSAILLPTIHISLCGLANYLARRPSCSQAATFLPTESQIEEKKEQ